MIWDFVKNSGWSTAEPRRERSVTMDEQPEEENRGQGEGEQQKEHTCKDHEKDSNLKCDVLMRKKI